jgi:hypothetical protein
MPVIKVTSFGCPAQDDPAAAMMAVTLAKSSERPKVQERQRRERAEKTRPRNPNRLTVNQHVFPSKNIGRFTNQDGYVSVHDLRRGEVISARPDNAIFCARRAWDERAETGYMKQIEDEFQKVIGPIVDGEAKILVPEHKPAIDRFYALWHTRSQYRELESQEIQLNGIAGDELTKAREENLEKNCYSFARKGGKMPARQLNGLLIQMRMDHLDLAAGVTRWGVISAQSGEFIVPDVPIHGIIPLTPRLALVHSAPDGIIVERNVAEINRAMRATSQDYFFAHDFSNCPF